MSQIASSIIIGTGSYTPEQNIKNSVFSSSKFYDSKGIEYSSSNTEIVDKFKNITNIEERKYVTNNLVCSDIALKAAEDALHSASIDPETLDYIIVAHNFGDVRANLKRTDIVPSIASRVKHGLKIKRSESVAYDILFGCPGWLQGIIQGHYYLQSGDAKRILVIGAETLSRVADPHDRDCMLYADGAGATILERKMCKVPTGILAHVTRSDTFNEAYLLRMGGSYNPSYPNDDIFLKMNGTELYKYALSNVPVVIEQCLEKAKLSLNQIQKILLHQANEKMDQAILKKLLQKYDIHNDHIDILAPMIINKYGNSSVATIPTLLDLILKGELPDQKINSGDNVLFASVGAGMNVNAVIYRAE